VLHIGVSYVEDELTFVLQELSRKANDLVRLALFAEQRRTVLRREEINKKGLYFAKIVVPSLSIYSYL